MTKNDLNKLRIRLSELQNEFSEVLKEVSTNTPLTNRQEIALINIKDSLRCQVWDIELDLKIELSPIN